MAWKICKAVKSIQAFIEKEAVRVETVEQLTVLAYKRNNEIFPTKALQARQFSVWFHMEIHIFH
jgi:hypothetical protein